MINTHKYTRAYAELFPLKSRESCALCLRERKGLRTVRHISILFNTVAFLFSSFCNMGSALLSQSQSVRTVVTHLDDMSITHSTTLLVLYRVRIDDSIIITSRISFLFRSLRGIGNSLDYYMSVLRSISRYIIIVLLITAFKIQTVIIHVTHAKYKLYILRNIHHNCTI